jgi:hypothetical protein
MPMTKRQMVEAAFRLGALAPAANPSEVVALFRAARGLNGLNAAECNRGLTPYQEQRRARLEAQVVQFCGHHSLHLELGRDQRGESVQIAGGRVYLW